jgi:YVTN family beta-propeller protein
MAFTPAAAPSATTFTTAAVTPAPAPTPAATKFTAVVTGVLAALGLNPDATPGPAVPVDSPLAWALLAAVRKFGAPTETSAGPVALRTTSAPVDDGQPQTFASFAALAAPNTPPTGAPTTGAPDPVTGAVSGAVNGTDTENDVLSYAVTTPPAKGVLTAGNSATGTFTYQPSQAARLAANTTPGPDTDTFVVTISDGQASTPVTVTVPVTAAELSVNPTTTTTGAGPAGVVVAGNRVYVANINANTVTVINPATNAVVATVAVTSSPTVLAASPNGAKVYVAGNNTVSVIDTATNGVTNIFVGGGQSYGIAVSPDGSKVYVTQGGTNSVGVINTATNTLTGVTFGLGQSPAGVTFSPNGTRAYVANLNSNTVTVINTANNTVVGAPIAVGANPFAITASPDGTRVYTANWNGTVSTINTATNTTVGGPIAVGASPFGITTSPDGSLLYVSNSNDTVSVLNTANGATLRTITIDSAPETAPHLIALSADGRTAYVTDLADNVLRRLTLASSNQPPTITTSTGATAYTEQQPVAVDAALTVTDPDNTTLTSATVTLGSPSSTEALGFSAPTGSGITGSYNTNTGVLTLTGTSTVANYQATLRSVTYNNTSDTPPPASRTVTFTTTDGSDPATPATKVITVTAVNDAPVLTTSTGSTSYTEQASPVVIDGGLTVTDVDSATLTGATVSITSPSSSETLAFTTGNGITGSYDTNTGVLTLTGTTTAANYQTTLRTVTYQNTSDAPAASRTITFTVTDGTTPSTAATKPIAVTTVNDPPVLTTSTGSTSYTEQASPVVIDGGLTVTDPDSATLTGATVSITSPSSSETLAFTTGNGITGSYNTNTGVLTLTGTTTAANYQTTLRSVTYQNTSDTPAASRTITFTVTDGTTPSTAATKVIATTALNDAPVVTTTTGASDYTEQASPVVVDGGLTVTDVDSATLTGARVFLTNPSSSETLAFTTGNGITGSYDSNAGVLTLTGTTSVANYETALRSVTYQNTSDAPATTRILSFDVSDGSLSSGSATKSITVIAVNDAPVFTTSTGSTPYTEQAAAKVIDGALTVTDVDSTTLTGATVTITGPSSTETLAFTQGNGITGSYNTSTGVLTLTGTTSKANYQTALRSVTYQNTSDAPAASRTITFTVTDGTTPSTAATKLIAVNAVNDPPVLTTSTGSTAYTEQASPVVIDGGLTVADPDSATLTGATVSITNRNSLETLAFTDGNGITGSINPSTGVLTLSGAASAATYESALRSVTYQNTSDAPATTRTITFTVTDGSLSASQTKTIAITTVNDPPAFSSVVVGQPAGDLGKVSGTITFTDPDNPTLTYSATGATKGSVVFGSNGAFTYTPNPADRLLAYSSPGDDVDSFTVTASDGTLTASYTVTNVPVSPALAVVVNNIVYVGGLEAGTQKGPDGNFYMTVDGGTGTRVIVINPADPSHPTVVNAGAQNAYGGVFFDTDGTGYQRSYSTVSGVNHAYVTVIDPSDLTHPVVVDAGDGQPNSIQRGTDGKVYVITASTTDSHVHVVQINPADPTHPTIIDAGPGTGAYSNVQFASDGNLYLTTYSTTGGSGPTGDQLATYLTRVVRIDPADPTHPTVITAGTGYPGQQATVLADGTVLQLSYTYNYTFANNSYTYHYTDQLAVVTPQNPNQAVVATLPATGNGNVQVHDVQTAADGTIYARTYTYNYNSSVDRYTNFVTVIDPQNPTQTPTTVTLPGNADYYYSNLAFGPDQTAYVTSRDDSGTSYVTVIDPAHPAQAADVTLPGTNYSYTPTFAPDGTAYVLSYNYGSSTYTNYVTIIKPQDPTHSTDTNLASTTTTSMSPIGAANTGVYLRTTTASGQNLAILVKPADPTHPVVVTLPGNQISSQVVASDGTLYSVTYTYNQVNGQFSAHGVTVVQAADPTHPTTVPLTTFPVGSIVTAGGAAYLTTGQTGNPATTQVLVFKPTDPAHPVTVGIAGSFYQGVMATADGRALQLVANTTTHTVTFAVISATDPTNPVKVTYNGDIRSGTQKGPDGKFYTTIDGSTGTRVVVIDPADPTHPTVVNAGALNGFSGVVFGTDGKAYQASFSTVGTVNHSYITVIDPADLTHPVVVDVGDGRPNGNNIQPLSDGKVYLTIASTTDAHVHVAQINPADPTHPVVIDAGPGTGTYSNVRPGADGKMYLTTVSGSGNTATTRVVRIDPADPTHPTVITAGTGTPGDTVEVLTDGTIVQLTYTVTGSTYTPYLAVVTPQSPNQALIAALPTTTQFPGSNFAVTGATYAPDGIAYIQTSRYAGNNAYTNYVTVIDPAHPAQATTVTVPGSTYYSNRVVVAPDGIAYAFSYTYNGNSSYTNYVTVIDPAHPAQAASVTLPGNYYNSGNVQKFAPNGTAYILSYDYNGTYTNYLTVVDPQHPAQAVDVPLPGTSSYNGSALTVAPNGTAYVLTSSYNSSTNNYSNSITIVDPAHPASATTTNLTGLTTSSVSLIAASDGLVLLNATVSGQAAIVLVSVSDPANPTVISSIGSPYGNAVTDANGLVYRTSYTYNNGYITQVLVVNPADPGHPAIISIPGYPAGVVIVGTDGKAVQPVSPGNSNGPVTLAVIQTADLP